jgi:hypothetical protein
MASPRRFPFDDDDRPSGSVRPLSQVDLQAILAHLSDTPTSCWPAPARIGRWWRCGCGPAWAARAARPRPGGGGCGRPSGPPGPEPCPGGWPPSWASGPVPVFLAACWRPGWAWWSAGWQPPRLAGGYGSSPAARPSPGGVERPGSGELLGCSTRWSGTGGRSCTTWPRGWRPGSRHPAPAGRHQAPASRAPPAASPASAAQGSGEAARRRERASPDRRTAR